MKKIITNILFIVFLLSTPVLAQKDTVHSLSLDIGIGYSRYITTIQWEDLKKYGFSGTIKVMWHPEHLLSLGLETGYHYLYFIKSSVTSVNFGTSSIEAAMIAVPILFVSSMRVFPLTLPHFEIQGGGGVYFLFNNGKLFGSSIYSSLYSFGYHLGAVYLQPLTTDIRFGGEVKYYYISKLQDADLSLHILFSYKFSNW